MSNNYNITEQTDLVCYLSKFLRLNANVITKLAIAVLRYSQRKNTIRYYHQSDVIYVNDNQIHVESWLSSNCKQCAICQKWFDFGDPYFFDYYIHSTKKNEDIALSVCGDCDSEGASGIMEYLTNKMVEFDNSPAKFYLPFFYNSTAHKA